MWPACASAPAALQEHQPDVAALVAQQGRRRRQRLDVAAVAVDEDQARRPARCGPAELDQQEPQRRGSDRDGAGEPLVLAAGAVADRGREHPVRSSRSAEPVGNSAGDRGGDAGVGVQRQVRSVLLGRPDRHDQRGRPCSAAASTSRSRGRWERPPADGRPNSPGVRQLLAHAQQLISGISSPAAATQVTPVPCRHACTSKFAWTAGRERLRRWRRRAPRARG